MKHNLQSAQKAYLYHARLVLHQVFENANCSRLRKVLAGIIVAPQATDLLGATSVGHQDWRPDFSIRFSVRVRVMLSMV